MNTEKLDNPVWHALTETHKDFAIDYNGIKFYRPDYCPFGGFINPEATPTGIRSYAQLATNFYVVGHKPNFKTNIQLKKELICHQMCLDRPIDHPISNHIIQLKTTDQKTDLYQLVNLVQPGYFKNKTSELGNYYGIYKDNKLIAATGERMKMNHYTEVSAVVTHPEHTGKGYAKQLVTFTSNKIFNEGKIPFLHVAHTNLAAIKLYEFLGYRTRRHISFWNYITNNNLPSSQHP